MSAFSELSTVTISPTPAELVLVNLATGKLSPAPPPRASIAIPFVLEAASAAPSAHSGQYAMCILTSTAHTLDSDSG